MTAAVENDGATQLRGKLRTLRRAFLDALTAICERKTEDGKPIPPSAAELTVIRGVLRDNGMALKPDGIDPELEAALEGAKADLPEFESDDEG